MRLRNFLNGKLVWAALPVLLLVLAATGCEQLDKLQEYRNATTEKITLTTVPPEMQADGQSNQPSVSADGMLIAFKSEATNLVIGVTRGASGVFIKNAQTGATVCASTNTAGEQGNRDSGKPAISADGRYVAFESGASNLVPGDSNTQCALASGTNVNCPDIFLKNIESGEIVRVSTGAAGEQGNRESDRPAISADGRYVAFESAASNLVPGDTNEKRDIFLKDMRTGTLMRVSADASGQEGDGDSIQPAISADGRYVAFSSRSETLVEGDGNGESDVFLKDTGTGAITLLSVTGDGTQGNAASGQTALAISADGRYVAFESTATNLDAADGNGKADIFLKDTQSQALTRVSVAASGQEGSMDSYGSISLSADGRFVAFRSDSDDLVPGDANGRPDVFLKEVGTGAITLLSADTAGAQGKSDSDAVSISADGRYAAFESLSANLVPGDSNNKRDIFLKDTQDGAIIRVSTSTADVL